MGSLIEFTNNYADRSTNAGYQFEFYCDGCGTGLMSPFKPSKFGIAGGLLKSAGNFFGALGRVSDATQGADDLLRGKERDEQLRAAVQEMKQVFKRCGRCGKWVCVEACWNEKRNLCEKCAPDLEEELANIQNTVKVEQMLRKARASDMISDIDVKADDGKPVVGGAVCASCGKPVSGKFCGECGAEVKTRKHCTNCGADNGVAAKFCGNCGQKMA